jgi:NAD(P)H-dependent FMN reductase
LSLSTEPLFIPVILGTPRQERWSQPVAEFVTAQLALWPGVETMLVDVRDLPLPVTGAGQDIRDPAFSELCMRADRFVIVTPEYNHGYPGLLKHALDTNLKEYIHKPVGICGVSAGGFGGTRVIENLLPVMRELGLVTIFWDVNFSNVRKLFGPDGEPLDPAYVKRIHKFAKELIWMARVLRYGREGVALEA